ncbi:MAG: hypothetical protein V1722_05730, partial [Candidatus Micrarchaeota archaeon]
MPNLTRTVTRAWETMKEGEVKTIGKHTVYRHRKMVILIHAAAGAKSLEQVKKTLNKKRAFHAIQ